jgi:hypothetical protein
MHRLVPVTSAGPRWGHSRGIDFTVTPTTVATEEVYNCTREKRFADFSQWSNRCIDVLIWSDAGSLLSGRTHLDLTITRLWQERGLWLGYAFRPVTEQPWMHPRIGKAIASYWSRGQLLESTDSRPNSHSKLSVSWYNTGDLRKCDTGP